MHRPTRSVWRGPAVEAPLTHAERLNPADECGAPTGVPPPHVAAVPRRQHQRYDSSAAATTQGDSSSRLGEAPLTGQAAAYLAAAASPTAFARRPALRTQSVPSDDHAVRAAKRQLERVQLALAARQRPQQARPSPRKAPDAAVLLPEVSSAGDTFDEQASSAAQADLGLKQFEAEGETARLAEHQVVLQREREMLQAERENQQEHVSQLLLVDEHRASAASAPVVRRENEARVPLATAELRNATLTIRELEEQMVASELAVGRAEASEQQLHQQLVYEQEGRAMLEAELARLQAQLANNHVALDEANDSEAAVTARLSALEEESKRSQREADKALAAATAELARAREQAEKRVAAARRDAEEASRNAKEELQRRVRDIQSLADSRVAAAQRQGDYYRLEAETLNLTSGFRSPNGTTLYRHGHLPAPEESFGECFTKTVR